MGIMVYSLFLTLGHAGLIPSNKINRTILKTSLRQLADVIGL